LNKSEYSNLFEKEKEEVEEKTEKIKKIGKEPGKR
jgi:hypothetical protein